MIEERFDPSRQEASESIFSIGNGHVGQGANLKEEYSGDTLQDRYVAGVYNPHKTRIDWWKNWNLARCINHHFRCAYIPYWPQESGKIDKAYELFLRTSRLDHDDYNHEVDEGLHITRMAGIWMAIVEGFGGRRVPNGKLFLNPVIHEKWQKYSFRILLERPGNHGQRVWR